jgi:hypothetical protein
MNNELTMNLLGIFQEIVIFVQAYVHIAEQYRYRIESLQKEP